MTRHRVPKEVLDAEDGYCQIDVGCILENGHEGDCDLRAALPPEPPSPGRPMTIRETAEVDALTLPPHQRPAAIERMVAERTRAAAERGIEKALEDQVVSQLEVHRAKIRIEVREDERTRNVSPRLTNVYFDGVKVGNVVAIRTTVRPSGKRDTYVVLRTHDAEIEWPEDVFEELDRVDISLRSIPAFEPYFVAYPRWSEGRPQSSMG
jgi:hypothetical protein